jgi:hypothetical protein
MVKKIEVPLIWFCDDHLKVSGVIASSAITARMSLVDF